MEAPLTMPETRFTLSLFYTAGLHGDLEMLPRLATFLKGLRAEFAAERHTLIDLGGACDSAVWHCAATDGRSMLIALDGLGYEAAAAGAYLSDEGRAKLAAMGDALNLRLLEADQAHVVNTADSGPLLVSMRMAAATRLVSEFRLQLAEVRAGEVGVAHVQWMGRAWRVASSGTYVLPPDTAPESTIAGLVDFIKAEARLAQKRRGGAPDG